MNHRGTQGFEEEGGDLIRGFLRSPFSPGPSIEFRTNSGTGLSNEPVPEPTARISVVQLGTGKIAQVVAELALISSGCEHLSVGKQCGRVSLARSIQAGGVAEGSSGRIVELGAGNRAEMVAGNDQDLSTRE